MTLPASDLAEARHRAYALFGQVFVQGLTEPVHARLAQLPAVADVLPDGPSDAAAAAHHEALSLDVFPYEAVFVDPTGLLEGASTAAVAASYRNVGFSPDTRSLAADHIGLQLACLAHLCAAEADAARDGVTPSVQVARSHAATFLTAHVLRWMPALVVALDQQTRCPWVARVGHLALELAVSHRAELGPPGAIAPLPSAELDLDAADTRVADIVRHLVRPVHAGWFLSRRGIARLAQALDLPTGFGPRGKMLEQVVFTAVDAKQADALFTELSAAVDEATAGLATLEERGAPVEVWRAPLIRTREVLETMLRAVEPGA